MKENQKQHFCKHLNNVRVMSRLNSNHSVCECVYLSVNYQIVSVCLSEAGTDLDQYV